MSLIDARSESEVVGVTGNDLVEEIVSSGFTFVTGVPDSPLSNLVRALESHAAYRPDFYEPGVREDACLALAAGVALGGGIPLVLMKSAGFGNCIDVLTSLIQVYGIPVVLLISWAGHAGRDIPHHNVIGEPLEDLARVLGIPVHQAPLGDPRQLGSALRAGISDARHVLGAAAVFGIPEGL